MHIFDYFQTRRIGIGISVQYKENGWEKGVCGGCGGGGGGGGGIAEPILPEKQFFGR